MSVRVRKLLAVVCGLMCTYLSDGFVFYMSVLFLELENEFGKSKAETAVVQSVAGGIYLFGGIFAGLLVSRYGLYKVGLCGATLEFLGLAASYFTTDIPFLAVSFGLITGFGSSLTFTFANTITAANFKDSEQITAMTVISIGSGIGSMTFPVIIDYLSQEYGWRGAMLILSAMTSHLFVFNLISPRQQKDSSSEGSKQTKVQTLQNVRSVLRNIPFMLYMTTSSLAMTNMTIVLILQVDYFVSVGYERSTAVFFLFIMSLIGTITRPLPQLIKKICHVGTFYIHASAVVVGAVGFALFPVANSYEVMVVLNGLVGIFLGFSSSYFVAGPLKFLDVENYPVGLGMLLTLTGILTTAGGPLAGLIKDLTGSYNPLYYGIGVCLTMCALAFICIAAHRKIKRYTVSEIVHEIN